ncbi:MAG: hypothetical protein JSS66_07415 [Armatimonadetes bacterium]|nr:hypothetical protein [Armatimonadota bacterium]
MVRVQYTYSTVNELRTSTPSEVTFRYESVQELRLAQENYILEGLVCIPSDDTSRLCVGFLTHDEANERPPIWHYASLYDTDYECQRIDHYDITTCAAAIDKLLECPDTVCYPSNDPRRLRYGWVFYPQREEHTLPMRTMRTEDITKLDALVYRCKTRAGALAEGVTFNWHAKV